MSSQSEEDSDSHEIPRQYKRWKSDPSVPIPIRTLHRWTQNTNDDQDDNRDVIIDRDEGENELNAYETSSNDDPELLHCNNPNASDSSSIEDNYSTDDDNDNDSTARSFTESEDMSEHSDNVDESSDDDRINEEIVNHLRDDLLYENSEVTVDKAIIILMDLYLKFKLSKVTLSALLTMLQQLLPQPNQMPKTLYHLFQYIQNVAPPCDVIEHYYCSNCLFYYGTNETIGECESCQSMDGAGHFYELDIEGQIRYMFEHKNLASKLNISVHENNIISDVTDGSEYIRVNSRVGRNVYDLTLILNTDGISLRKSSTAHCWPLMFKIAELPDHLRDSHIVVIGLWYDENKKPLMNTFLQPFCIKLAKCYFDGVSWYNHQSNRMCKSKIVCPLIIADAPARAQLQNIVNFNGKYGCNICEIKTRRSTPVEGKKTIRVYAFHNTTSKLRSNDRMLRQADKAFESNKTYVKGIKGKTVLSALPFLDWSTCVLPEYMHSACLGAGRQFVDLWISKQGAWNIKHFVPQIDEFIMSIKPPDCFNRMPKRISKYSHYKASEFLNLILYYSPVVLCDYLPDVYFQHWLLFVASLFELLKKPIYVEPNLEKTEILLRLFVREVETLYSDRQYTYNVHQLLHLVECVKRWGPLFATSAFPFEDYNGIIASCVHGTKHLGREIMNNCKIAQGIQALKNMYDEDENNDRPLINQVHGAAKSGIPLHDTEIRLLEAEGVHFENLKFYARAMINKKMYTSQIYKIENKVPKTNSYTVQVVSNGDDIYGSIRFFFRAENRLYFIIQHFAIEEARWFIHRKTNTRIYHIIPINEVDEYTLIQVDNIISLSHLIRVGDFVCKRPNLLNKIM